MTTTRRKIPAHQSLGAGITSLHGDVAILQGGTVPYVAYMPPEAQGVTLGLLGSPGSHHMYGTSGIKSGLVASKQGLLVVARHDSRGELITGAQIMRAALALTIGMGLPNIDNILVYSGAVPEAHAICTAGLADNIPLTFVAPAFIHDFSQVKHLFERWMLRACTDEARWFDRWCLDPLFKLSAMHGESVRRTGIVNLEPEVWYELDQVVRSYRLMYWADAWAFADTDIRAALVTVLAQTIAYPEKFAELVQAAHRHQPKDWQGIRLAAGSKIYRMRRDCIATQAMAEALAENVDGDLPIQVVDGTHFSLLKGFPQ